jgi:hypothetical protein
VAKTVKWLELDRDRRRRVARAVRKGLPVTDPRDAPYAVAFADASLEWLSWKRRFRPLHLLLISLVVAELTLAGAWHPALVLYPLLGFAFLRLRAPHLRKRAGAAREANAELAERMKLPAVSIEMPGRAFFAPKSRLRRRLMVSLLVALVSLVALAVAATVWAVRADRRWGAAANPICARELARIAALRPLRLSSVEGQFRLNAIEQDTVSELEHLGLRTRLQKNFLAWRAYEVELDVWILEPLERGDRASVELGRKRIRWARAYSRKLARQLRARACAEA